MLSIILASTSPYRRQLLARLHINFKCASPGVCEDIIIGEPPDARALRLAEEKSRALAAHSDAIFIGGDQTICGDGQIFDKPGDAKTCAAQLRAMSGKNLHLFTAVAVFNAAQKTMQSQLIAHRAQFRNLSDAEIERYIKKETAFNCAGGAQIEGLGIALLDSIAGDDPTAIAGLPLITVAKLLRAAGADIP